MSRANALTGVIAVIVREEAVLPAPGEINAEAVLRVEAESGAKVPGEIFEEETDRARRTDETHHHRRRR